MPSPLFILLGSLPGSTEKPSSLDSSLEVTFPKDNDGIDLTSQSDDEVGDLKIVSPEKPTITQMRATTTEQINVWLAPHLFLGMVL